MATKKNSKSLGQKRETGNVIPFPSRQPKPEAMFDDRIDLLDLLITNQDATIILDLNGDIPDHGLSDGDRVIFDTAIPAKAGDIISVNVGGDIHVTTFPDSRPLIGVATFILRELPPACRETRKARHE